MDKHNSLGQFFKAVFYELYLSKRLYNLLASTILLGVVVGGYSWPERYISSATILVEKSLDQSTPPTLDEKRQQLLSLLKSPLFFDRVERAIGSTSLLADNKIDSLAQHLKVEQNSSQLMRLTLHAATPQGAQNLLQEVIDAAFESLIPMEKLDELRAQLHAISSEMEVIQREMNSYEVILASGKDAAESNNSRQILNRIANLKESIQDDEVNLLAIDAKINRIRREQAREKQTIDQKQAQAQTPSQEELRRQRDDLNNRLIEQRREFGMDSAEAIGLEVEIEQVDRQLSVANQNPSPSRDIDTSLYEQLRKQLTLAQVEREALVTRSASLNLLLEQELAKAATHQVNETEYQTASKHYESYSQKHRELAKQKVQLEWQQNQLESTLDAYKLFSKPSLPESYSGLGIVEFLILSPLFALAIPFLLAALRVIFDFRIRTSRQLKHLLPANLAILAEIPHCNSPQTSRLFRNAIVGLLFWAAFVTCVYFALGIFALKH